MNQDSLSTQEIDHIKSAEATTCCPCLSEVPNTRGLRFPRSCRAASHASPLTASADVQAECAQQVSLGVFASRMWNCPDLLRQPFVRGLRNEPLSHV